MNRNLLWLTGRGREEEIETGVTNEMEIPIKIIKRSKLCQMATLVLELNNKMQIAQMIQNNRPLHGSCWWLHCQLMWVTECGTAQLLGRSVMRISLYDCMLEPPSHATKQRQFLAFVESRETIFRWPLCSLWFLGMADGHAAATATAVAATVQSSPSKLKFYYENSAYFRRQM